MMKRILYILILLVPVFVGLVTGLAPGLAGSNEIITHGNRAQKVVALTFDADMTPKMLADLKHGRIKTWYDRRITETLEKKSVAATIFVTGLFAQTYPEEVKSFARNPLYEIENHSWDHAGFEMPCFGLAKAKNKLSEIMETQKILQNLTGKTPQFFRFPGGCANRSDFEIVKKAGLKVVGWDTVSGDSYLKNPQKIVDQVLRGATGGSIVVMHFSGGPHAPSTALALPKIIAGLCEKGFAFVTVAELLKP